MTTAQAIPDFGELRSKVRATQHARSIPLLVIGALLVNYAVVTFASQPVAWRYGAPLAFVLVWALGKVNEINVGVGHGRADYLIAAGVVFIATNVLLLDTTLDQGDRLHQLFGIWVGIVGVALAGVSFANRDRVLLAAAAAVLVPAVALFLHGPLDGFYVLTGASSSSTAWPMWLLAAVGAVLGITGLLLYRRERTQA